MASSRRAWSQAFWWGVAVAVMVVAVFLWRPPRFFGPDCDALTETLFEALDRNDLPAIAAAQAESRDANCGEP